MNENNWTYQCPTCIHNHNVYYTNDCHSVCAEGHCILCIWQKEQTCNDYKEGEAIEEVEE